MLDRLMEFHTQGRARATVKTLPTANLTCDAKIAVLRAKLTQAPNVVLTEPCCPAWDRGRHKVGCPNYGQE